MPQENEQKTIHARVQAVVQELRGLKENLERIDSPSDVLGVIDQAQKLQQAIRCLVDEALADPTQFNNDSAFGYTMARIHDAESNVFTLQADSEENRSDPDSVVAVLRSLSDDAMQLARSYYRTAEQSVD